ncbi:DNA mismatch repair protein MutT [Reichenbachiella sp. 5M10]|uniref:NUDIX hydrolase n=1 Tax=Reichenbachiella sp. 5M10 TaxID=1889772 RepID=UPI000C15E52E|nr:NUDIX domain-containing protein [Reichenbachiella sp. 5M10]PIB34267.1 DNA mismatch repair protein MutT [Reichenbachiella sp. 5M10]
MNAAQSPTHSESYQEATPILVAVDNVIFGFDPDEEKLKVLLFKRQVAPQAGTWSLIGSFIQPQESGVQAAARILQKFTGLDEVYLEQFHAYTQPSRDPGARVISITYYSLIRINEQNDELVNTYQARWFDLTDIPPLVVDHNHMVQDALTHLQGKIKRKPIGFNLLPDEFTLPKLLKLYMEIYQAPIDDRNFRKKILSTGILDRLDKKDKSASKKGAFLYQFNEEKYFSLVDDGYDIAFL